MKKLFFFAVMALMGVNADAQFKPFDSQAVPQRKTQVTQKAQKLQQPSQVAGTFNAGEIATTRMDRKYNLDANKLVPVQSMQHNAKQFNASTVQLPQRVASAKGKSMLRSMNNVKPIITLNEQTTANAPRKAPNFKEKYTGVGGNYFAKQMEEWTMTPTTGTITDEETGEEKQIDLLVDIIPTPDYLSNFYPKGTPVEYTIEGNVITINPQAILSFKNEAQDSTFYVTIFSANSEDEDGNFTGEINMELAEDGKLTITNGNEICIGVFANVEFDPDLMDGDAFLELDEYYFSVAYYYNYGFSVDLEYNGSGIDAETSEAVNWTMKRGTFSKDDEKTNLFIDMCPFLEEFSGIFPDGVDVEYTESDGSIIVKPQLLASYTAQDSTQVYLILHSNTAEDGKIVLKVGENGSLTTIKAEEVTIGAWETEEFDSTYDTYLGYYASTRRVRYQLPGEPPFAPEDPACEPDNLVLHAAMGISGYHYMDNLAVTGAYAPTVFRNITEDPVTSYAWSVTEYGLEENIITGSDRDFTLNTIGDYVYGNLNLTCENQGSKSETYGWGYSGVDPDTGEALFDSCYVYAGGGASSFQFSDGSYATMTRHNPDIDIIFYTNFGTPDHTSNSISTIYSYQGKPSTPLYLTGVTLPIVGFNTVEGEDFGLHVKLMKCTRNPATGRVTVGDVIAEADADAESIMSDYAATSGLTAVEFTDFYVEDEMGLSETLDYIFVEDEFLICIEGWDNGTFSGVLGSDDNTGANAISTWFTFTGEEEGRLHYYTQWKPTLFIGLLDATYGYLHTEDSTDLTFEENGGEASIHIEPMFYTHDDNNLPVPSLYVESITIDGEDAEEVPEWLEVGVDNLDQTINEDGYPNSIDYDLVFVAQPLGDVESRNVEIVYMQRGARLKVTISQSKSGQVVPKKGDVNGDGLVDVADISQVIAVMAAGEFSSAADVNGDGKVDVADISQVISIMANN